MSCLQQMIWQTENIPCFFAAKERLKKFYYDKNMADI